MDLGYVCGHAKDGRTWGNTEKLVDDRAYLGIEIELENMLHFQKFFQRHMSSVFWKTVIDNSLRNNGIELIMTYNDHKMTPLLGEDVIRALDAYERAITEYQMAGYSPEITCRTSTHIHLDVRDLSTTELVKLILIYTVFEESLFRSCEISRADNQYCKPIFKTRHLREEISNILTCIQENNLDSIRHHLGNQHKYTAFNLGSIQKRGSVEVRLFPATLEKQKLLDWINILLCMKKAAKDPLISVEDFPERVSHEGFLPFMEKIFGAYTKLISPFTTNAAICNGVRVAQEIIQLKGYRKLSGSFEKSVSKKANEPTSLLHKFAKENNLEVAD